MASQKTALITGISGQDGSYLAELLCGQGYRVLGASHRDSGQMHCGAAVIDIMKLDLADTRAVNEVVATTRPDEIYNLAARASSAQLFDDPIQTAEVNGVATVRFLEAIRQFSSATHFCQAASSEIFAGAKTTPQSETTEIAPVNSYGAAKAYGLHMIRMYRERYGLHASTAILFNHESPRREEHYVTRKIAKAAVMIAAGKSDELELGNLDSRRDWGYAGDYVNAIWRMSQYAVGDDYVIATGETHSVRDFCKIAFEYVGLNYNDYVKVNKSFGGRIDTVELRGNPGRAEQQLGWRRSVDFPGLVKMLVDADRDRLKKAE
ncbi:GDP-mannose 4,6-dehydratase [Herbaspirillum sp. RV1423]|uniref:GDP-mannose 4,6-dehydratase n=1 Tax=Herbaspirillum sp. RV1423 TaxID=1443993 RepID=UPI00054E5D52|nr:GDP-mannose 4,6-dehydratase [Herbaspirillum sp. RV1423]